MKILAFAWNRTAWPLVIVMALAAPSRADIDLTGRWYTPQSTTRFADVVQTGSDITLSWTYSAGPVTFTGTFDQTTVVASAGSLQIRLTPRAEGDILYGKVVTLSFPPVFLMRCECDDGNTDDDDGCDSECRVEECYTCAGEPSVCVPSADTDACDDRRECTTGETCTSGSCGAGTPLPSCIDVSGLWRIDSDRYTHFDTEQPGSSRDLRIVQQTGALLLYEEDGDLRETPAAVGTISPTSGAMAYSDTSGIGFCSSISDFHGTASGDAESFAGSVGHHYQSGGHAPTCSEIEVNATGTRCHAALGCDLTDCTGLPDGTPCDDGNLCTNPDACSAGACASRPKCPLCQACDSTGDCDVGPSSGCSAALKNQLMISWKSDHEQLRWLWKKGAATALDEFGNPAATSEMALCIYQGNELAYRNDVTPDEACEEPPCWAEKADRLSFKGSELALSLRAGDGERAGISFKSTEALPWDFTLPLTPPLSVQLQIDNGACFGSTFGASGVTKNENGRFKAKAP